MTNYIKPLLIFLGVSIVTLPIHSQSLPDSTSKKIDSLFKKWDNNNSPGCALGIVKDGQLIYKRGYGMANLDYNIPISPKSVFSIASISKQFTAMSILLLSKQGKLSLDDEIQKYLPEVPRYQSPITIRHLIYHTSGIRNYGELVEMAGMRGENVHLTDDDFLGLIARQKELNFKPGEEHVYSNSGYFLMGLIVKKVSGKSLREFAEENIFRPLGMNNTHFHDDRNMLVRNRVTAYLPVSNGAFAVALFAGGAVGGGGLYTSVEDLFLWDQNFYNNKLGGGTDLISDQLSTGKLNNGEKVNYAFGLQVGEWKGLKWISHGGSGGGFRSEMIRFPSQNFSVICLCNAGYQIDPDELAEEVTEILLADQFKKSVGVVSETKAAAQDVISIPEKELASLAGLYFDPIKETIISFYMKEGKLMIFNTVLSPHSQNRFKLVGGGPPGLEIIFVRPITGRPMQVKFVRKGNTTIYDAVQTVTPTSIQLTEFAGKYISHELGGATYTLSINDTKLLLQVRNGITVFSDRTIPLAFAQPNGNEPPRDIFLAPTFADAFDTFVDGIRILIRFTRNQQNQVSGFKLSTGTVRRLRFDKQ